ncbi:MAG: hypothetical protein DRI95_00660 [Bacteroidetes bacterium]|nr:MAG: hypothetical protein DRI95_00660 [Bacteroidota bacterium]
MRKKMYLIEYYGGSYDDFYTVKIFATANKTTATKYVTKFNKLLKKWKKYYSKYEEDSFGIKLFAEKYIDYYDRYSALENITKCYYYEIKTR